MPIVHVTPEEIGDFAPDAKSDYRAVLEARLNTALLTPKINASGLRLSHFMAQIGHECGLFTIRAENMRYRTKARLLQIFGVGNHSAAITETEAPGLLDNPAALAERVYGLGNLVKARELGNTTPGDGFNYRGRGFLQITGRGSYRRHGVAIGRPEVEQQPELAEDGNVALELAIAEWMSKDCNEPADADNLRVVTKRINGGTNNMPDRVAMLKKAKGIWLHKTPE